VCVCAYAWNIIANDGASHSHTNQPARSLTYTSRELLIIKKQNKTTLMAHMRASERETCEALKISKNLHYVKVDQK
jgi:hypothetical protein